MIAFEENVCRQLDQAAQREWLETNGIGGFASSTIVGMNTRRYHGLLVAALKPPVDRYVLLSKLEETLIVDGSRVRSVRQQVSRSDPSAGISVPEGLSSGSFSGVHV